MKSLPVRLQLTAWYSLSLLLGLLIFGSGAWLALDHRLIAGVDVHLAERLQGLKHSLGNEAHVRSRKQLQRELEEAASQVPDGTVIELQDHAGTLILPYPQPTLFAHPISSGGDTFATIDKEGKSFRVLSGSLKATGGPYAAFIAISLDEVNSVMHDFRNLLLMLIPLVLLVTCAGGYALSGRALRPVDAITTVARSISAQNLSERITVPRTGDELERMAETWNEVLERLDSAVKRIRQFTADASHELRTPLTIIRATAGLALRRERDSEAYRQALREIEHQSEVMTGLTESMLTMARSDFEGTAILLAPADLGELAASTVQQGQAMALNKGVQLIWSGGSESHWVTMNASGIQHILRILIDNALKHTTQGGAVTVAAESAHNGATRLSVVDNGEGIAAAHLPFIFERFYSTDPTRSKGAGFGLGLAIAQSIARAHGSVIVASSIEGEGSRFSITLRGVSEDFHASSL